MAQEPPKLLDRVRAAIRTRHYSRRTEEAYVYWIRRYILFHGKRHPTELGAPQITTFLRSLVTVAEVAASTQNQAFSALMFLYRDVLHQELGEIEHAPRAKAPFHVPVILSTDEVRRVLAQMSEESDRSDLMTAGVSCGARAAIAGSVPQTRGKAQVSQRHGANRIGGLWWIAARSPQPTPQLAATAQLVDSRGRRASIRPFNDMERDLLLAGYRGWLRAN